MTVIAVAQSNQLLGFIAVADTIKSDSKQAITTFKELGLTPILLTGDNKLAAESIAEQVGIQEIYSEVMPEDKVAVITQLQAEGKVVAMVGDGVNDAAALVKADLGMSMGSGTDVAIEASDITLVNSNLTSAATGIKLARRTLATIKGNLFWAFAYNVAAIPLAMAGLLNPMIAGAAMAFSSVFVVTNSLRLRRFH
jgi:Cu+-exporting ATPase